MFSSYNILMSKYVKQCKTISELKPLWVILSNIKFAQLNKQQSKLKNNF